MAASSIQVRPRVLSWAATLLSGGSLLVALLVALPFQAAAYNSPDSDCVGKWTNWVAEKPGWESRQFQITQHQYGGGADCEFPARQLSKEYRLIPACAAETCDASCPLGCDDCLGRVGPWPYVDRLGSIEGKYHIHRPARPGGKVCEGWEGRPTGKQFHISWCTHIYGICENGCPNTVNNFRICYDKDATFRQMVDRNNETTVFR